MGYTGARCSGKHLGRQRQAGPIVLSQKQNKQKSYRRGQGEQKGSLLAYIKAHKLVHILICIVYAGFIYYIFYTYTNFSTVIDAGILEFKQDEKELGGEGVWRLRRRHGRQHPILAGVTRRTLLHTEMRDLSTIVPRVTPHAVKSWLLIIYTTWRFVCLFWIWASLQTRLAWNSQMSACLCLHCTQFLWRQVAVLQPFYHCFPDPAAGINCRLNHGNLLMVVPSPCALPPTHSSLGLWLWEAEAGGSLWLPGYRESCRTARDAEKRCLREK